MIKRFIRRNEELKTVIEGMVLAMIQTGCPVEGVAIAVESVFISYIANLEIQCKDEAYKNFVVSLVNKEAETTDWMKLTRELMGLK